MRLILNQTFPRFRQNKKVQIMSNTTHHSGPSHKPFVHEPGAHKHPDPIPKAALLGMLGLVMVVLIGVTIARFSGFEPLNQPQTGEIAAARSIAFEVRSDGGLDVFDAASGQRLMEFPDTSAGFMLGAHRAFMFERKRSGLGVDMNAPVEVVRWADGRMSLIDPQTGWRAELHNFGITPQATFARVLEAHG